MPARFFMDEKVKSMLESYKPTKVTFGNGCISQVGQTIKQNYPEAKTLVITGRGSAEKSGSLRKLKESLESAGVDFEVFSGVEPDPSSETTHKIVDKIKEGFHVLAPLGGGSSIDASKAADVVATLGGHVSDYFGNGKVRPKLEESGKKLFPVLAIPTTSGTGAEVTKFSVITDKGVKLAIRDEVTCPMQAFVDPELTYSCSSGLTVTVGLDTLGHLLEGYLNNVNDNVDPHANERALFGLKLVFENLPQAYKDGQGSQAREMMALASVLGGMVINYKPTGIPHGLSLYFHDFAAHGDGVAVLLPYAWAYYLPNVEGKTIEVARLMGIDIQNRSDREASVEAVKKLIEFIRELGHPISLREIHEMDEETLKGAVRYLELDPARLASSPRQVEEEEKTEILHSIIKGAYEGRIEEILKL
jgi:alcohol dehydrogenase class IV